MSSNSREKYPSDDNKGGVDDDRGPPPRDRSRSRSPRRGRRRSRSRSYSRSRSPPDRRRDGGRRRSPPRRGPRGRSRSFSGSRSRSPPSRGGRYDRDRDRDRGRDDSYNDRRGPPGGYGRGPRDDYRGGRGGYDDRGRDDYGPPRGGSRGGPPPHQDPYYDQYGPPGRRGGDPYGPPRGRGGPTPNFRGGGRRDRSRRDESIPGISLLVRNIGPHITNHDLGQAFGRIGDVRDVYIPRDYHSQQAKGFAFIEYADPEQAREAQAEMDRFNIKGCVLEVVFAQERRKSPNEMRGRVVNQQNHARGRERSSSFERHQKQRRRDEGRRNRDKKDAKGKNKDRPPADRKSDEGDNEKSSKEKEKSSAEKGGEE